MIVSLVWVSDILNEDGPVLVDRHSLEVVRC